MTKVSAVILAGGQGRRMGHANKGLQTHRGKQLIEHVIERLSNQVDDIVISANEDQGQYQTFGYPVVADVESSQGPLTGIFLLQHIQNTIRFLLLHVICQTCRPDIVSELLKSDSPVVMTRSNKGIEPLVSLVNREAIQNIEGYLASGQRSVARWLESCGAAEYDASALDPAAFFNVNTLDDLKPS